MGIISIVELFLVLYMVRGARLICPLPSISTHGDTTWHAFGVNWKEIIYD